MFITGIQPNFSAWYSLYQENRQLMCKGLTALVSSVISVASTIFLIQEMQEPDPTPIFLTSYTLALGASIRVVSEVIPFQSKQTILEGTTRWALEIFEVFWNVYLNVSSSAQPHLLNCISCWAGFHFAGDTLTLLRNKLKIKGIQNEETQALLPNAAVNVNAESVEPAIEQLELKNQLLRPDFNNRKKIILLNTVFLVSGAALLTFTQLHGWNRVSIEPFFNSLSYLLIGKGTGRVCIEISQMIYDKYHNRYLALTQNCFSNHSLSKYIKKSKEFLPGIAVEVISALPISKKTLPLFLPVGFLYESVCHLTQRKFQTLTEEVYQAQIQHNLVSFNPPQKRTAIKVDEIASVLFLTIFTGWFSYGFAQSASEERIEIAALLLSTWVIAIAAKILDKKFWPQRNNQFFNECYYLLFHNSLFLSVIYMMITQVSNISDVDLSHDLPIQRLFGICGLSLFGMMLASGRIAAISLAREDHPLTTSTFRMMSLLTIFYRCLNELD